MWVCTTTITYETCRVNEWYQVSASLFSAQKKRKREMCSSACTEVNCVSDPAVENAKWYSCATLCNRHGCVKSGLQTANDRAFRLLHLHNIQTASFFLLLAKLSIHFYSRRLYFSNSRGKKREKRFSVLPISNLLLECKSQLFAQCHTSSFFHSTCCHVQLTGYNFKK